MQKSNYTLLLNPRPWNPIRAFLKFFDDGGGTDMQHARGIPNGVYWQKGGNLRGLLAGCYERLGRLAFLDRC